MCILYFYNITYLFHFQICHAGIFEISLESYDATHKETTELFQLEKQWNLQSKRSTLQKVGFLGAEI